MSMKTLSGKTTLVFVLLAMICPAVPVQAADTNDALLNMLPQNCMFCLRINDFNQSLGKMDQYMAGVSPVPMSLAMLANMQLGAVIGDPMLTGIDMGGDFAVFAIPPQADETEPVAGMLIPVTDYKTFVEKNPNCKVDKDGTAILSAPNSPMGGFAMKEAGQGEYALVVSELVKEKLPALAGAINLFKSEPTLAQRITPSQAKDAATAPAWAYMNLAGIYEKYSPMLNGAIQTLEQKVSAENAPAQMAQMKKMMEFYVKVLPEIVKELGGAADSMTLALTPEPTILNLDLALRAKDGSKLAGIFVQNPKADSGYTMTGYLDNSNAVNGLMKMNISSVKKMYDLMFEILNNESVDSKFKEQINTFKASLEKTYDAMGDEVAFSFSYANGMPPVRFTEVVGVKNAEVMKEYMQSSTDFITPMYKSMGFPVEVKCEPEVSTYKNVTIGTFTIGMAASDDPNSTAMQDQINLIYGPDGLKYYFAYTADNFYMAMGADGENTLKKLIDQSATASAPSGDIKIAMDTLKDTPFNDFVCSVNVIKLMKGFGEMMESMGPSTDCQPDIESAIRMFGGLKDVQTQSCLVMGGNISDGQAAMRLAVPKQHLVEIIGAVMQMQAQAAAAAPSEIHQHAATHADHHAAVQEVPKNPLLEWVGKPAPELKMVDLDGKIHRVSRLKGKKTILDFWATWCPPCKKAVPDLIKLRTDSKESELVIIGLSDEPTDTLSPFVKEYKINYPIVADAKDLPAPYSQVTVIPTVFLIDSKGIIQDVLVGYHDPEDLQTRLNKLN
ncbi:MAG: TlpA family protein disulfide reductase [Phycisphaerae bacterium]|nr:TlpA family protein disulfide reductase [Phycisphaerae bacterium]